MPKSWMTGRIDVGDAVRSVTASTLIVVGSAVACAGCSSILPIRHGNIGETVKGTFTTAEYRHISERDTTKPARVVCTEPSPDIAKAVSAALTASNTAVHSQQALSYQQAETIAQLGKRYATVQLLRDMRFRDCEDFANGAIDQIEYGYRLARFSALVVTLFSIEMVGGENAATGGGVQSPPLTPTAVPATTDGGDGQDAAPSTDPPKDSARAATPTPDLTKPLKTAATSMAAVDAAVAAADAERTTLTSNQTVGDKDAVAAIGAVVDGIDKDGKDLQGAWTALLGGAGSPSATVLAKIKTVDADKKALDQKRGDADKAAAVASKAAQASNSNVAGAAKKLATATSSLDALAKAMSAAKPVPPAKPATKPEPAPHADAAPPPAAKSVVSDAQAGAIVQIHGAYLKYDDDASSSVPCASVENQLKFGSDGKPRADYTAFQYWCLSKWPSEGAARVAGTANARAGTSAAPTSSALTKRSAPGAVEGRGSPQLQPKPADEPVPAPAPPPPPKAPARMG